MSKSGSFRGRQRPSSVGSSSPREETRSPSGSARQTTTTPTGVSTIGGIGRPTGATSSSWGNQFLELRKVFETKCSDDKEELSGEDTDPSRDQLASPRQEYSQENSPASFSPLPSSGQSVNRRINIGVLNSSSGSSRLMSDETGQKEESQSNQSQSDEGDEYVPRSNNSINDNTQSEELSEATPLRYPSHTCILDGRTVHKELDQLSGTTAGNGKRSWSDWEDQRSSMSTPTHSTDSDLLTRIDCLLKEKNRLDSQLQEMTERSQSLQRKLTIQQKSFAKTQDRSNDTVELLKSENSHLTKSLSLVEKERDQLTIEIKELQTQLEENLEKLVKMEKLYHEAETHGQEIKKELSSALKNKEKLQEQKNKLDSDILEARKTKESLCSTIHKLKDQNSSLEEKLNTVKREKSVLVKEKSAKETAERNLLSKLETTEKSLVEIETENERITQKLQELEKERVAFNEKLQVSNSTMISWRKQCEEIKREKEVLNKKLLSLNQCEVSLQEKEVWLLNEIETSVNNVLSCFPSLKLSPTLQVQTNLKDSELPLQLKQMMSLHSAVITELTSLTEKQDKLAQSVSTLNDKLSKKEMDFVKSEKLCNKLTKELEACRSKSESQYSKLNSEYRNYIASVEKERERTKDEMTELIQANETLEEDIEEVSNSYHVLLEEKRNAKRSLQQLEVSSQEVISRLLVEKVCLSSLLILNTEKLSELSSDHTLHEQMEVLTSERSSLKQSLEEANTKLHKAQVSLEKAREDHVNSVLETDKLKVQLMTEISLLKSQVSSLEKDKTVLEMQSSSSTTGVSATSSSNNSAFQPVLGASGRKTQQEIIDLQHKVTLLENENKRLNDIIHSSSSSLDTGNALRRQILEMRKKIYFLEAEKKQMTEKVSNLHNSLKMMRESKDRLTQDRLKTLQEENTSLQDRIRNMEDMFTRKLMCSDATIASTAKENDTLRLKLNVIPDSVKIIKSFNSMISELATAVQTQEDELVSLRTSLSGAGISLSPAGDILERVLKNHADIQELLANRNVQEEDNVVVNKGSSSLNRPVSNLPPVLKQLSPEYISSLQGNNTSGSGISNTAPITRSRSQSHSQPTGLSPLSSSAVVYQIREKLSQIYADNLSISDLFKHVQETLGTRHVEVVSLQKNLASFQSEIKITLRSFEESHENLSLLWEQELPPEQLNSILVLKHQVETWQDKVIARDMALKDIDLQMKEDYEAHNRRFSLLKGQVLDLKEEISMSADALLAKDQYIHEVEERSLNAESELYKLRKEMECILQEALNVPEGFQLQSHGGNVPELVRLQTEELHRMKGLLNEYVYQINQLQARVESMHRDNTLLQHQGIEQERHHRQVREDLHTERDYLRQQNFQLIEQQLKGEEVGDLLKKLKRSQEAMREQRELRALACELDNVKLMTREKDLRISELQHQLHSQQLETLKAHHRPLPTPTGTNEGLMPSSHKTYPHVNVSGSRAFSRPHSASSAESARPSRYIITDPNHPKVINRNKLPSTLEGDFLIQLPPTTSGGGIVNLSENSDVPTGTGGYYIGYPVVTDDEGSMVVTDENSPKQPQKNRVRRHRRTASTGSDSLKNFLSSGSSASDSRPSQSNQSSTLPLSVTRQHKPPIRPGSADSMRFEMHSPVSLPPDTASTVKNDTSKTEAKAAHCNEKEPNDTISRYAKDMQEGIGKMISQHDKSERDETTPLIPIPPTKDKVSGVKSDTTTPTTKSGIWNQLTGMINKGSNRQFAGIKSSGKDKQKTLPNKTLEIPEVTTSDSSMSTSHKLTDVRGVELKPLVLDDSVSTHLSRIPSLASSVGRSDSIASTSTTFSGLGGESSPYSTLSLDSLHIDSFENMLHLPYFRRGVAYTPVVGHHTSSSDEEGRPVGTSGRTTLKRNALVTKTSKTLPHLFQPVSIHHRGQSSCDSDQLQSDTLEYVSIPLQRSESISISDMDKDLTDNEAMQEKIHLLSKQLGRVRRSSTGSITICTHSGSSMEDIKGTD